MTSTAAPKTTRTSTKATRAELQATARNLGCPGALSRMSMDALATSIERRRAYLATPAADIPKSPRNDRFQGGRQGSTYTCRSCRKLTRETGNGESGVDLCAACLDEAEAENAHSDYGHDASPVATCPICQADAKLADAREAHPEVAAAADEMARFANALPIVEDGGLLDAAANARSTGPAHKVTASPRAAARYQAQFGIAPEAAAGLRYCGTARQTGTLTSVYNGAEAGLDTEGGPWTVLCETHSYTLAVDTLKLGLDFSAVPAEWCEPCAEVLAGRQATA